MFNQVSGNQYYAGGFDATPQHIQVDQSLVTIKRDQIPQNSALIPAMTEERQLVNRREYMIT
jgi:hypothetical protein